MAGRALKYIVLAVIAANLVLMAVVFLGRNSPSQRPVATTLFHTNAAAGEFSTETNRPGQPR